MSFANDHAIEEYRHTMDQVLTTCDPAQTSAELQLQEAVNALCERHGIEPPELYFNHFIKSGFNAEALLHRNVILVQGDFIRSFPELRHQLAIMAHEIAHILTQDTTPTKEVEYRCDRLAAQLVGNTQDLAEALTRYEQLTEQAYAQYPEESVRAFRESTERTHGLFSERITTLQTVDATDRTELEAFIATEYSKPEPYVEKTGMSHTPSAHAAQVSEVG